MKELVFQGEVMAEISACLERGNSVELKLVGGQIQVIEIRRKVKIKASAIGQR